MAGGELRVVFGIGNPGPDYEGTRHNLGFRVVDAMASAAGRTAGRLEGIPALGTGVWIEGKPVLLVKPLTYVNRCGPVLRRIRDLEQVPLERTLVVVDDVNLPVGRVRLRLSGGDGGHKGVLSLISFLESGSFPRLRLGIGRPAGEPLERYVLSPFPTEALDAVAGSVARALTAVRLWVRLGGEAAMTEVNRRDLDPPEVRA